MNASKVTPSVSKGKNKRETERKMGSSALSSSMTSSSSHLLFQHKHNPLLESVCFRSTVRLPKTTTTTRAMLSSTTRELALKDFNQGNALKIISGLQNYNRDNVAAVVTAADQGGATHVDIACDAELVKLALSLTSLPICVSSVNPHAFLAAIEAGAQMVEIGNYDSFYNKGLFFSQNEILKMTQETRKILPSVVLSVTVPHMLPLPDQVKLAELLEQEGADIIQTEGGKCFNPSKSGVFGLIEKATPSLASTYSIARAIKIPVMCSSGLSAVTAPMALAAGASGVGIGTAVNKLNNVVAMIAEVRSLADSLGLPTGSRVTAEEISLRN
ncbi:hypothetical protein AQUCO_05700066v1 [Aquilegia coerulea]|uniref:Uncharacterized protein ycf23 n=1 Tax=Aquilegia coerulea TaxID=218851 RepID=A0A2G5CFL3_AQUCA|nr:hypothetical protein AQUCO_05700066v1 [Aquilegia coerulea]